MASEVLDLDQPISCRYELISRNIQTNLGPREAQYISGHTSVKYFNVQSEYTTK